MYKHAQDADKKGVQAFGGSGRPTVSSDELIMLKRENARLKKKNKIVESAAARFTRELS